MLFIYANDLEKLAAYFDKFPTGSLATVIFGRYGAW